MKANITAGEVSRLAGFRKPWMLGHLEREGIFVREHCEDRRHGRARKYTFADVVILRSINRMLELGARPARIKQVIAKMGSLSGLSGSQRGALSLVQKAGTCLFVTEKEAYLVTSKQEVLDLTTSGQLAFSFMIDIEQSLRPVIETIAAYKVRKSSNWKRDENIFNELCESVGL